MAGLRTPLSTLHVRPHDRPRMPGGRCGSLLLHRKGLAPSALCRSPGAPDSGRSRRHYRTAEVATMSTTDFLVEACTRRLRGFSTVNRDEMRLAGYPDSTPEID